MTMSNVNTNLAALAIWAATLAVTSTAPVASAQGVSESDLTITDRNECQRLARTLRDVPASGEQWLIGRQVKFHGLTLDNQGRVSISSPIETLSDPFRKVQCYDDTNAASPEDDGQRNYVFVADKDFSSCGWVAREELLPEYRRNLRTDLESRRASGREKICPVPQPMPFSELCRKAPKGAFRGDRSTLCDGVALGLRSKAVLTGATELGDTPKYPFYSTPDGRKQRESRAFFSILEIHNVAARPPQRVGDAARTMVLVGDGGGEMFGWVDLDALRLWPTRLGMFFDLNANGVMFQRRRDMIFNWRRGTPGPDVRSQGKEAVGEHVHGELPLVSYPIVRTVYPADDPSRFDPSDTPFHELVFLGQTGDGATSQLLREAKIAEAIRDLGRVNIMFVVDSTESMVEYLPPIQEGISAFINEYGEAGQLSGGDVPKARIAVYAYSDFATSTRTSLGDKIDIATLLSPVRVGPSYDVSDKLAGVSGHRGLTDRAGGYPEAAYEAVLQLSERFEDPTWFENGPRIVIHIADHGSRKSVDFDDVYKRLTARNVLYFPIAVTTDDKGEVGRENARIAMEEQSFLMWARFVKNARAADLLHVDFKSDEFVTADTVTDALLVGIDKAMETVREARGRVTGSGAKETTLTYSNRAIASLAARIDFDERLSRQYGLDDIQDRVVAVANSAYAPLRYRAGADGERPVEWVYTVALDDEQFRFLQEKYDRMCLLVGRPEQQREMRSLVIKIIEAFSGDEIRGEEDVRAVFSDLGQLPGVRGGLLSIPERQLLQKIKSTDPTIVDELRRDVCWTSYHLNNVVAEQYAKASDVVWNGVDYELAADASVSARLYRYRPVVGPEVYYLPAWFFLVPSIEVGLGTGECQGWVCED